MSVHIESASWRPVSERAAPRITAIDIVLAALGALCLAAVARVLWTLDLPFTFSNEGWTAYHAADAASGAPLYPGGLVYNNYPPLGYYLIGWLGRLIGDTILAGRILSVVALAALAAGVRLAARQLGCNRREAGFAGLILAATMLYDYDYVGVCDPQIIANAIQVFALVLCLKPKQSNGSLALAALIFAVSLFVKHAAVVQPLAALVWLGFGDRRNALKFAGFGAAFVLLGAALFQWVYGHPLLDELHNARVWRESFALQAIGGRAILLVPLAAAAWLLHRQRDRRLAFSLGYAGVAAATATYFLGGAGTGGKMLFDTVVALALGAGVGLHLARRDSLPPWVFLTAQIVPVAAYVVFRTAAGTLPHHWLATDHPAVVDTARDIAFLKAHPGDVLCNEPVLCFQAGKAFAVDLWGYEEAVAVGDRDGHELIDAVNRRQYAVLQLAAPPDALGAMREADPVWAKKVSAAIIANYRVERTSANGAFWIPKERP